MQILCLGKVTEEYKKSDIYNQILKQKNIILKGRVKHSEVESYIAKVDFILNTSLAEGLSNVFLEGWNLRKPVVSYIVNPNEYLTKGQAGYCAGGSLQNLIDKLKEIKGNNDYFMFHGQKGKEILMKNHNMEQIISKYIDVFNNK